MFGNEQLSIYNKRELEILMIALSTGVPVSNIKVVREPIDMFGSRRGETSNASNKKTTIINTPLDTALTIEKTDMHIVKTALEVVNEKYEFEESGFLEFLLKYLSKYEREDGEPLEIESSSISDSKVGLLQKLRLCLKLRSQSFELTPEDEELIISACPCAFALGSEVFEEYKRKKSRERLEEQLKGHSPIDRPKGKRKVVTN
jgi:hypothetical protein